MLMQPPTSSTLQQPVDEFLSLLKSDQIKNEWTSNSTKWQTTVTYIQVIQVTQSTFGVFDHELRRVVLKVTLSFGLFFWKNDFFFAWFRHVWNILIDYDFWTYLNIFGCFWTIWTFLDIFDIIWNIWTCLTYFEIFGRIGIIVLVVKLQIGTIWAFLISQAV